MNKVMKYKGYIAMIKYIKEDSKFFGSIVNLTKDRVYFAGQNYEELTQYMHEVIDGYEESCKILGIKRGRIVSLGPVAHAKRHNRSARRTTRCNHNLGSSCQS